MDNIENNGIIYTEKDIIEIIIGMKEEISDQVHQQWSHWMKYELGLSDSEREKNKQKWERQIDTDYKDLSNKEKESDRFFADKIIKILYNNFMTSGGFVEAINLNSNIIYCKSI